MPDPVLPIHHGGFLDLLLDGERCPTSARPIAEPTPPGCPAELANARHHRNAARERHYADQGPDDRAQLIAYVRHRRDLVAGVRFFRVGCPGGSPTIVVPASDPTQAVERYNALMGIRGLDWNLQHAVEPLDQEQA